MPTTFETAPDATVLAAVAPQVALPTRSMPGWLAGYEVEAHYYDAAYQALGKLTPDYAGVLRADAQRRTAFLASYASTQMAHDLLALQARVARAERAEADLARQLDDAHDRAFREFGVEL